MTILLDINQYARLETVYDQGSFDFAISGSDDQLQFFPVNSSVNDYDITSISYNLNDNYLSTGSTSIGGVLIDSESVIVNWNTLLILSVLVILITLQRFLLLLLQMLAIHRLEIHQLSILMILKHRS